ncbi:conjugative transposon protein TraN [Chryseobacterium gallinarum]|nr:conjugative transposon protein TraN [Chryseobacterium gallinarum]
MLILFCIKTSAQDTLPNNRPLPGWIKPYKAEVAYDKTTHILFPSAIRYVDIGSEYIVAEVAGDADNVLRVKASVPDFEIETNLSVVTHDGRFYSFNVHYNANPIVTNYDLLKVQQEESRKLGSDVLLRELGNDPSSLVGLVMETLYKKDKKVVRHIGSKSFGIQFLLKGIYIHNGKYYFHTELRNHTHVPFDVDFINFKIVDKKIAKRTVIQETPVIPLRTYKNQDGVGGKSTDRNIFLLDRFTLASDKMLLIEIFEKNGGRHQVLQVENEDLIRAKLISDMHLRF